MKEVGFICADVEKDFRYTISESLLNAKWSYFLDSKAGNLSSAIGSQVQSAVNVFRASSLVVAGVIQITIFSTISLTISVLVTFIAFVTGFVVMMILSKHVGVSRAASKEYTMHEGVLLSVLIDGLKSIKTYKAMGLHSQLINYLKYDIDKLAEMRRKIVFSGAIIKNFQEPIQIAIIALSLYFLTKYWEGGIEQLIVLILLFYRTGQRLGLLQVYYQQIVTAIPPFWFVTNIIDLSKKAEEDISTGSQAVMGKSIEFKDVYYSYKDKCVLNGVSVCINSGDFVSIVGGSGEGKTTLLDMILGFNTPESGVIEFDGTPINSFSKKSIRSIIGYVPQETTLFHDTIRNNITFGDESVSDKLVNDALHRSGAIEFISNLSGGLDFVVGEHGGKISGGQKQRIGIARALLNNPKILILDEPTSALDKDSEKVILNTLKKIHGDITIIVVSHQNSFIGVSDEILLLNGGILTKVNK
jgi:ATP-binding cassette subfamily C protein